MESVTEIKPCRGSDCCELTVFNSCPLWRGETVNKILRYDFLKMPINPSDFVCVHSHSSISFPPLRAGPGTVLIVLFQ